MAVTVDHNGSHLHISHDGCNVGQSRWESLRRDNAPRLTLFVGKTITRLDRLPVLPRIIRHGTRVSVN